MKRARPILVKSGPDVDEALHAAPRAPGDREFLRRFAREQASMPGPQFAAGIVTRLLT